MTSIENLESLNNLNIKLNPDDSNANADEDPQEVKFIRESKKKQTIFSKMEIKFDKIIEANNIEQSIVQIEEKLKIDSNKTRVSISTNSVQSDGKGIFLFMEILLFSKCHKFWGMIELNIMQKNNFGF